MEKKRRRKIVLGLLLAAAALGSSAGVALAYQGGERILKDSQDKGINHALDDNYATLCQDTPDLTVIEKEGNVLPKACYALSKGDGKSAKTFILDEGYWTFAINLADWHNFHSLTTPGSNFLNVSYVTIDPSGLNLAGSVLTDAAPDKVSPSDLFASGSNGQNMILSEDAAHCDLFVTVKLTPAVYLGYVQGTAKMKIRSFDFEIDANLGYGDINYIQLFKGQAADFPGPAEYLHDECGLTDTIIGPYESGKKISMKVPYGSKEITAANLMKTLKSFDKGDNKNEDIYILTDDYTGHENVLGTPMNVVYGSKDKTGNESKITFAFTVTDFIPPVIVARSPIQVSYTTNVTEDLLLSYYSITDNYPSGVKEKKILNYDFTASHHFKGVKKFTVQATDTSGNVATLDGQVEFIDDMGPLFTGQDFIHVEAGEPLSDAQILAGYSASDDLDGVCAVSLTSNGYKGNEYNVGTYAVTISATDKSGNTGKKNIIVDVKDDKGPLFYVNKTFITTYGLEVLTPEQVISALVSNGTLPYKRYNYSEFVGGDYPDLAEAVPGTYQAMIEAYAEDGTSEYADVTIEVKGELKTEETELNWWQRFCLAVASFFQKINNFFAENL
jgi:hypothetical protein